MIFLFGNDRDEPRQINNANLRASPSADYSDGLCAHQYRIYRVIIYTILNLRKKMEIIIKLTAT